MGFLLPVKWCFSTIFQIGRPRRISLWPCVGCSFCLVFRWIDQQHWGFTFASDMSGPNFGEKLGDYARRVWEFKTGSLFLAVLLQCLILIGTGFVVVFVPGFDSDPEFVAKKTIYLPQRELEHRASVAELRELSAPSAMISKLTTSALLPVSLPDLPMLPSMTSTSGFGSDFNPQMGESLLGQSGLLSGIEGIDFAASEFSILGISDRARRLVIAFDISSSVVDNMAKSGMDILLVRDETAKAVDTLNANTLFGLIQFSRRYDLFSDYLVPATKGNKRVVQDWLETEFRTTGSSGRGWVQKEPNGIQAVLKAAFEFDPDVILLISDGSFQRNHPDKKSYQNVSWEELLNDLEELQQPLPQKVRIHFVGFGMKEANSKAMQSIVRRYKGRFKSF